MNLVENEKHQARQSSNSPRHAPCHRRVKETNARFFDVRAQPARDTNTFFGTVERIITDKYVCAREVARTPSHFLARCQVPTVHSRKRRLNSP